MNATKSLDDAMTRVEKREGKTWRLTLGVTTTLFALGMILIYIAMNRAKDAAEARAAAAETISTALEVQVKALINGPVQAYVRPGEMGGRLVQAETKKQALETLADFQNSSVGSIRTKGIDEKLAEIQLYLSDLAGELNDDSRGPLGNRVLELAAACGEAWKHDSQHLSNDTRQEFDRYLYQQAMDNTAAIAQATHYEDTIQLRNEFWSLYYGKLPLIETRGVALAMVAFGKQLKNWTEGPPPVATDPAPSFVSLAENVAAACRQALQEPKGEANEE